MWALSSSEQQLYAGTRCQGSSAALTRPHGSSRCGRGGLEPAPGTGWSRYGQRAPVSSRAPWAPPDLAPPDLLSEKISDKTERLTWESET